MRIAELAPLWKPVPPLQYGGTELVVANVTNGLVEAGHEVTLFACAGSQTKGKLVEVLDAPMYDLLHGFKWDAIQPYEFLAYDELFKRLNEFDVIHNHMQFSPLVFERLISIPIVSTLHSSLPPDFPYLAERFKDSNFVSISNSQRQLAPYLHYVKTIYHGIDTTLYKPGEPEDYLLFIGSLTPQKGIDRAVQAAHKLGKRLIIAGEKRAEYEDFLSKEVYPYIDGDKIRFIGEVGGKEKIDLYSHAQALLLPMRWSEAFGLVMAEALASGTPVIAYNNGSASEIIEDSVTGYLVNSQAELEEKIMMINHLSRPTCRQRAEERFSIEQMAQSYADLFTELIKLGKRS